MNLTPDGIDGPADNGDYAPAACACGAECERPTDKVCDDCWHAARIARAAADTVKTAELPAMTMQALVFGGAR